MKMGRIPMKIAKHSLMAAATLGFLSATALSQQKPGQVATGTEAHALPLGQVRPMTVAIAKQLVAAARKADCAPGGPCTGAFAIVDDAGVLVDFEIIDGVLADAPDLAIRKAKTSALWRRPTKVFRKAVDTKRNSSYAGGTFQDMTTSPGGVPLFKDGRVVGGFGIADTGSAQAGDKIDDAVIKEAAKLFGQQ
jgi:glc operon protein GlcG